jgi:hypothetical protein
MEKRSTDAVLPARTRSNHQGRPPGVVLGVDLGAGAQQGGHQLRAGLARQRRRPVQRRPLVL